MNLRFCFFIMMDVQLNGINTNGQRMQFILVLGDKPNGIFFHLFFSSPSPSTYGLQFTVFGLSLRILEAVYNLK